MAIGGFEELIATILLMVIPDPIVWVVLFILAMLLGFVLAKVPGTTAVMLLFLTISTLTDYIGGVMHIVRMIMYVALGFSIILALIKIGNR